MKKLLCYISKVNYATSRTKSLKAGFPKEISEILKTYAGDEIEWCVNLSGDKIIVTVKKRYDENHCDDDDEIDE